MVNSSIPLQTRTVNALNAIGGGMQLGQQATDIRNAADFRAGVQQHGAAAMGGNRNALNALAGLGPEGLQMAQSTQMNSLNMDATRQGMAHADAQQGRLDRAEARQVAQAAAQMSAAQRMEAAAEVENATKMVLAAQSPQQWDMFAQQYQPELVGQFQQRDAIAAQFMEVADILKGGQVDEPASIVALRARAQEAGLQRDTPEYRQFMASGGVPSQSTSLTVDPDTGAMSFTQGTGTPTGGNGVKTTEGEKSSAGYLSRMQAAEQTLKEIESEIQGPAVRSMASLLVGGTNFEGLVLSDEQSRILQAQRDWVRAKLRKESGAVIGDVEMAEEVRTYFPLPGEGPEVAEQKRLARLEAERQFEIMSGNAAPQKQDAAPSIDFSTVQGPDLLDMDVATMSDADLAAWNARMDELGL